MNRRQFFPTIIAGSSMLSASGYILPEQRPPFAPDPNFIPMLERIVSIQPLVGDTGRVFHLHRILHKKTDQQVERFWDYSKPRDYQDHISFGIGVLQTDATAAPTLDIRHTHDRVRLMNMMVDFLMANTLPLPRRLGRYVVDDPRGFGFRRAMNHIAMYTRRGVGNVLVANTEGFQRLNGSWHNQPYLQTVHLPLDNREPFALLGYKGENKYDAGAILAVRITDDDYASVKKQFQGSKRNNEIWQEYMRNRMHVVRPVFMGNNNAEVNTANYWRKLV